jgi:multicomponent Na+:H+ antiporter subunit C
VSLAVIPALAGAALIGIGLYGLITANGALHRILGFNILGGGAFLVFGFIARRGAGAGFPADPVPQALVITGIVVAFSATALAAALVVRLSVKTRDEQAQERDAGDRA